MLTDAAEPLGTEVGHPGSGDGNRLRSTATLVGRHTSEAKEAPSAPRPHPSWSSGATSPGENEPAQPEHAAAAEDHRPAPSPHTVVVASGRRVSKAREQARAQEAALRAEYAAEIARLTRILRETRRAHAAELDRLRADHAAKLRRLVEAQWRTRDATRGAEEPPVSTAERIMSRSRVFSGAPRPFTREWLARILGRD